MNLIQYSMYTCINIQTFTVNLLRRGLRTQKEAAIIAQYGSVHI